MSDLLTQGTKFRISADDITFTDLGCVTGWSLETGDRAEIDTTCLTSVAKRFKFGLKDFGTLSVDTNYEIAGAGQLIVEDSYASDVPFYFEVEYSDSLGTSGTIKSFQGYVTSYSETGALDGVVTLSMSIKIDGEITKAVPVA